MSLADKLAAERRGRLAAERLLELKQAELFAANRKLGLHARALSEEIVETRAEVESVRDENRRVKSDLSAANEKVEIAEKRLWHSIASIQDGFAFFDPDDRLVAANDAYLVIFDGLEEVRPGIPFARILQLITEEGIVDTGDLPANEWRRVMLERRQIAEPEPHVIRLWNDQYVKIVDHRTDGGDIVTLALNITETVRYERQLREARSKAEEAARAKSAFLANMSHEIRTPMNGVVGMAELLSDGTLTDDQQLYVDTIRASGEALLVIINDILDFSKMEAEKLVLHATPFDLERAVLDVMMLVQPACHEKNIALLLDFDPILPQSVIGDMGRVRQILTNLIGNAVKFTTHGHVILRVRAMSEEDGHETGEQFVQFDIEDTGIGIAQEQISQIFGEFTQVEDERNRQFEGTGLGLSISQKLVELMDGKIWATSTLGEGSVFSVRLGLPADAEHDLPQMPDHLRRALVIDATQQNREILCSKLEHLGIETETATGASDAVAQADTGFDLILIDTIDPDLALSDLLRDLNEAAPGVPVTIVTANPARTKQSLPESLTATILQRPVPRSQLYTALADIPEPDSLPNWQFARRTPWEPVVAAPDDNSSPAVPRGFKPSPSDPPEALSQAPNPAGRRMRILAAEDNKTNRLVLGKLLKSFDINLEFAENGEEAVEKFTTFSPDMLLMDISMPKVDGKEATRQIRALEAERGGHVPIVAMTAHALEGDKEAILEAGLDDYLTKPLRKALIADMIATYAPKEAAPIAPAA